MLVSRMYAQILCHSNKLDDALDILSKCLLLQNDHYSLRFDKLNLLLKTQKHDLALELFEETYEKFPFMDLRTYRKNYYLNS